VFVETPRFARLSRQQWANAVRDLLMLSDISDIESNVSGDALVGFDAEAEDLFVTEQLRSDLFDASEKAADKVTGDAAALERLVPADAPTDAAGRAEAFITSFGRRAFRRPLTDEEVTTHLDLFNQGPTLYAGVDPFKAGASLVILGDDLANRPQRTTRGHSPADPPQERPEAVNTENASNPMVPSITDSLRCRGKR
jgi:hypothetical protein